MKLITLLVLICTSAMAAPYEFDRHQISGGRELVVTRTSRDPKADFIFSIMAADGSSTEFLRMPSTDGFIPVPQKKFGPVVDRDEKLIAVSYWANLMFILQVDLRTLQPQTSVLYIPELLKDLDPQDGSIEAIPPNRVVSHSPNSADRVLEHLADGSFKLDGRPFDPKHRPTQATASPSAEKTDATKEYRPQTVGAP